MGMRRRSMKAALLTLGGLALLGIGYYVGAESVDQTLYCGEYTYKYDDLNGCEILPGYTVVKDGS